MFKLRKSDMELIHSQFAVDSINILHSRFESDADPWSKFSLTLKNVLDSRFGGEWNILIGKAVGYAMKTRKKSSVVTVGGSGEIVICWRSPGFEVEDVNIVKLKAQFMLDGDELAVVKESAVSSSKLNIIESPLPDSIGYTLETAKVVPLIDSLIDDLKVMETQQAARHLRNHLTARFGTIWHVAIGETRAFHVEAAQTCTDHVIVATKKGGLKIEVFRHKQTTPHGFVSVCKSITMPKLSTVFEILPSILFILLCVAFMMQRSAVCHESTVFSSAITKNVCGTLNSVPLAPLAGMVFVLTLIKQVKKTLNKKKLKNI